MNIIPTLKTMTITMALAISIPLLSNGPESVANEFSSLPESLDLTEDQLKTVSPPSQEAIRRWESSIWRGSDEELIQQLERHKAWIEEEEAAGRTVPDHIINPANFLDGNISAADALQVIYEAYCLDIDTQDKTPAEVINEINQHWYEQYYPEESIKSEMQEKALIESDNYEHDMTAYDVHETSQSEIAETTVDIGVAPANHTMSPPFRRQPTQIAPVQQPRPSTRQRPPSTYGRPTLTRPQQPKAKPSRPSTSKGASGGCSK